MSEQNSASRDINISGLSGGDLTVEGGIFTTGDVSGDVVGRDKIINHVNNFIQQARSAVEEAEKARSAAQKRLAEGVRDYAQRLRVIATDDSDAAAGGPYKGLLAYRLSDAELFFGRNRAIGELLEHVQRGRLTILHAESGAGKSSLLQAGLANRLLGQGHLPVCLRPYDVSPTLAIKRVFLPDLGQETALVAETWVDSDLANTPLRDFLGQVTGVLGPKAGLYLCLDQFEETFTLLDETERGAFVNELADCLEDESLNVRWILALRTEFFGNLASFRPRLRNPFENDYRLNRLTLVEARTVITEPAIRQGISFEPELVATLLKDLHDEQSDEISPPQIQLVCSALYNSFQQQQRENPALPPTITRSMYEEEGRAEGILRGYLNRVLRRTLSRPEREAARQLLIALVSSDQRRIRRTKSDLAATLATYLTSAMSLDSLLDQLVESRLLNVEKDEQSGESAYELAHDLLLAEIELDPETQARKAAEELLKQEVQAFKRHGTLLSADKFDIINSQQEFLALDDDAAKLLRLSRAARRRAQIRRIVAIAAVLLLIVGAAILFAVIQQDNANKQANLRATAEAERDRAEQQVSRELAANALAQMPLDAELGRLLALEAADTAETDEVERALLQTILNPLTTVLRGHTGGINSATFSPDGKRAITVSIDESVRIWDTTTWKTVKVLPGNLWGVANETFSPDGSTVVITSAGGRTAWDTNTWQEIAIPAGLEEKVAPPSLPLVPGEKVVASSPDGRYALTSGEDGKVQVWETGNVLSQLGGVTPIGEEMRQLGGTGEVTSAAFSPDGQLLITRKLLDNTAALWEVATGRLVSSLVGHTGWIWDVAFSPDSRLVATAAGYPDNSVRVWDVMSKRTPAGFVPVVELHGHASEIYTVNFSPDSKLLITAGGDNTARIWEPGVGQNRIRYLELKDYTTVYSTAFSPDGRFLVLARGTAARVWDTSSGQQVHLLEGHTGSVRSAVYSPDSQYIVTASDDKTVRVWEAGSGQQMHLLEGHTGSVRSAVYSPDGQYIVTASDDKTVRVWEAGSGQEVRKLEGQRGFTDAEFSPDGALVVTTGWLPGVRVWEARTGRIVVEELHGHTEQVNSVAFSPDGKFVVTASWDNTAKIWETATGRMVADLLGHIDQVYQATFSPDGRFVLTAGADYTARLWDAQTGQSLLVFRGHSSDVRTARFSPDGKLIATGSDDGTVQVFKCDVCGGIEELKHLAQNRVFRELTCEERQRFLHEQVTCPTPTPIAR